ncbi:MAG: DctP family TRAP transporter solute-binding subunit [Cloacibacillus sp.]
MKQKNSFIFIAVLAAVLFSFSSNAWAAPKKIIFTTVSLPNVSYTKVLYTVVKPELEKLSGGTLSLEIFDSSKLFSQDDELPAVIKGNATMCYTDATWLADYMPSMKMMAAGYLFSDRAHMDKVLNGALGKKMFADVAKKVGVRPLGAYYIGARHIAMRNAKIITKPEDLKGVKLRTPNSSAWLSLGKALGANPVPIAFSELYTALQTGTVDGLENPLGGIDEGSFFEVIKTISLNGHMIGAVWPAINEKFWQGLTQAQQTAVVKAFEKGMIANEKLAVADEKALLKKYQDKYGIKIVKPDVNAFKKRVRAYYLSDKSITQDWDMGLYKQIIGMSK